MGWPLGNPKPWEPLPHINIKDCSQGLCSLYCPQWCYAMSPPSSSPPPLPPSPPPPSSFSDGDSGPALSPVIISVMGILITAFLLLSYYTVISKYCRTAGAASPADTSGSHGDDPDEEEVEEDDRPSSRLSLQPWYFTATRGLDDSTIMSIAVCRYRKGEGLVQGTDCSVCLAEFREEDRLRFLPRCCHAFHVPCIDAWLRSHTNCPLCRANVVSSGNGNALPPLLERETSDSPRGGENGGDNGEGAASGGSEGGAGEVGAGTESGGVPKSQLRAFSDLGNSELREAVIEIREGEAAHVGRSVSMDGVRRGHGSVVDFLRFHTRGGSGGGGMRRG